MAMVAMAATHGASSAHRSSFLGTAPISSSSAAVTLPVTRRGNATVRCDLPRQNKVGITPMEDRPLFKGLPRLGPDIWNKTYYPKEADHLAINKPWYIVDASNKRLGRLASTIAHYLRGKDNPMFTPSLDMGSYVVVINAEKVGVTGNKRSQKLYRRHSGRPGGLKEETFDQLQKRIPERIVEHAVRGMLPKNRLGRAMFRKLKVFKGPEHPHAAQKPVPLPIHDKRIELVTDE